jgi:hypothetical protein
LGLAGYYRKHIKDYSKISAPSTDLTKGESKSIDWTPACQEAFNKLKYALTHAPVLAYHIYSDQFTLTTDAFRYAAGTILLQTRGKKVVVIAYGGRKLTIPEQNYMTTGRECLAVIETLKEVEPYVLGQHMQIITDHAALKWIFTQKQPPGCLARWIAY